jgi:SNF2 family DNA or RNA helicase
MRYEPYQYQRTATRWIIDKPHCGLFLDMGLGKTVSTLTAIQQLIDDCEISTALVVAPKKVAETTWSTEAEKWDHLASLRVAKVLGTEKQRSAALESKADVYVTSRDLFAWLVTKYKGRLPFDVLVIDELTSFKSNRSQRFKAMRIALPSVKRVIGLTGTPAPNGLIDLWAQMYCIDQGERLGKSITRYRDTYFVQHKWNNIVVRCELRQGAEKIIRDKIADVCLSMQAKDYLDLPAMITHTVSVELSDKTLSGYQAFERDKVMQFAADHADEPANVLANSAAGLLNKLSQYANGAVYDEERQVHEIHDEKLERLAEIVEAANGSSVLVFYQYRHDVPRIAEKLKGYRVRTYEGEADLLDWNAGKIDVLLAHPASTAYGLNMQQGGHYIVWFGTGWNLEHYQQANARLHRQGQRYPVTVYKLICRGTVDERAAAAIENKKGVQQGLLDSLNYLIRKHSEQPQES